MPQSLDKPPEYIVAELLESDWNSANTESYNPVFSGTLRTDDFPVSTDWNSGDVYPILTVTNNTATVVGGGNTNVTGIQGDGSGVNQQTLETMLVTVQADSDQSYNGSLTAEELCHSFFNEIRRIILSDNITAPSNVDILNFFFAPPEHTTVQSSSGSTVHQYQSEVSIHWNREP